MQGANVPGRFAVGKGGALKGRGAARAQGRKGRSIGLVHDLAAQEGHDHTGGKDLLRVDGQEVFVQHHKVRQLARLDGAEL